MRRVSIAGLMAVVLVCGVAAAALREASETWAGILLLVTVGLLAFALLAVRQRREASRAFWEGFALFGWGYLVLTLGPWFAEQVGPKLPTAQLLGYLHGKLNPAATTSQVQAVWMPSLWRNSLARINAPVTVDYTVSPNTAAPAYGTWVADLSGTVPPASSSAQNQRVWAWTSVLAAGPGNLEHFQRVGQCLFALLAAVLGGVLSRRLYRTRPATAPVA
jgi:hypothetical protein